MRCGATCTLPQHCTTTGSPTKSTHATWTSGSPGTALSGRDSVGTRPRHRLIDFTASECKSSQTGCRKQQGWKPAQSKSFLQCFGRSAWIFDPVGEPMQLPSMPCLVVG